MTQLFVLLTMSAPAPGGARQVTIARTFVVAAGATRTEVYMWARSQCPPEFANGNVLFFSVEPNVLPVIEAVAGQ
ncbi:hypothetical protein ABZU32_39130 [Sphaerisporangium sp. NPDC005288]|uniref:Uncharacterized protein n=1 Tax=Sphaerisporangium dianthi TaxID=1436120 RepID=A0ABV9CV37_9ACTN